MPSRAGTNIGTPGGQAIEIAATGRRGTGEIGQSDPAARAPGPPRRAAGGAYAATRIFGAIPVPRPTRNGNHGPVHSTRTRRPRGETSLHPHLRPRRRPPMLNQPGDAANWTGHDHGAI